MTRQDTIRIEQDGRGRTSVWTAYANGRYVGTYETRPKAQRAAEQRLAAQPAPCFACEHRHLAGSRGDCTEAACDPTCTLTPACPLPEQVA